MRFGFCANACHNCAIAGSVVSAKLPNGIWCTAAAATAAATTACCCCCSSIEFILSGVSRPS
uniref:Uncharacterized protein n=1 Tax=Anopheles christyi TaxID=43041 RepID=A0A182KII0_9DIPT